MPFAVKRYAGFHRTARAFQAELREVAPDLLFVNVNGSEAVSLAGPACGVPVVNCYHLSYTPPAGGLFTRFGDQLARRATIQSGTLTVHVSMAARDQWCSMFRYPADRTRVIYNGVEPPNLAPRESTRRALNLPSDAFVFCSPGRFDPIKGHTHLVDAMRLIKDRIGQAVLLLCGDGELRGVLEEQVTTSGLADKVRFLGWRDDVPAILHAADCMVLPSLSENLSLVAIESALVGTPSIVTRVGGMAEVVQDRSTGHIVPSAKPEALAEAMSWMVSNRQAAAEMGRLARADALNRFTRERMMAEYVATFADVLGRRT
jgi:glycosyltransferase involved in cell wall biosynthesis